MDYYFFIKLRRKVPTRKHKLGMDTAVCRAESKEAAVAQLLYRRCGIASSTCPSAGRCATATPIRKVY